MQNKVYQGQVGLVLLVIMGVVVALVMSVASRSLSDTVLSRQEKESSAAFAVAEAGVESAMNALRNPPGGTITGNLGGIAESVTGEYTVTPSTNYDLYVREGEVAYLDVPAGVTTLTISWTKKADPTENIAGCAEGSGLAPAAIEVTSISATKVVRSYYNPASCNPGSNGFAGSSDGGSVYRSTVNAYSVPAGTTKVRIKPIYTGATILVSGAGSPLGDQLYLIKSKASGGDAQKEIEVKRGLDGPPSIFDFAVFSAGTIVK